MSNRRTRLNGIHRTIARKQGVNAAAWFAGQSFTSGTRGDALPTDAQLTALGEKAHLLLPDDAPEPEPLKTCVYCGGPNTADDDFYCSNICAINAQGEEDR